MTLIDSMDPDYGSGIEHRFGLGCVFVLGVVIIGARHRDHDLAGDQAPRVLPRRDAVARRTREPAAHAQVTGRLDLPANGEHMSDYAVVNPATGETLANTHLATDAELEQALATADTTATGWARHLERRRAGRAPAPRRRAAPRAARRARRDHRARDGQAARRPRSERSTSPPTSPSSTPTTPRRSWPTSRSTSSARAPRSSAARRSGCCWASCRGTSRTTRSPASRRRTSLIGNTILLKHAPQCPESSAAIETIYRDAGLPRGRLHRTCTSRTTSRPR